MRDIDYFLFKLLKHCPEQKQAIEDLYKESTTRLNGRTLDLSDLIDALDIIVPPKFSTTPEGMRMKSRKEKFRIPRQVCHWYARQMTEASLAVIGRELGEVNHATVMNSVRKIDNDIETNKKFAITIGEISEALHEATSPYTMKT